MKQPKDNRPRRRIHPVHKRIALHASSLLVVFSAGFLPLPISNFAQTESYVVSARVPAELPSEPAIITSPSDGDRFATDTITVSGTCPNDTYVKVMRGTDVAGIAVCSANSFAVQISLVPGANQLTAKVFNITDDEGPASPVITVYYDKPVAPPPTSPQGGPTGPQQPTGPSSPPVPGVPGFKLDIPYNYTIKVPNETWQWELIISGGTAPYTVTIDWGDGTTGSYSRIAAGPFTVTHAYNKAGSYRVIATAEDARGNKVVFEVPSPVKEPFQVGGGLLEWLRKLLASVSPWIIWPIYIILLLCILAFWMYEAKRMHRKLRHHNMRQKHG